MRWMAALMIGLSWAMPARAQIPEIRFAQQFSMAYSKKGVTAPRLAEPDQTRTTTRYPRPACHARGTYLISSVPMRCGLWNPNLPSCARHGFGGGLEGRFRRGINRCGRCRLIWLRNGLDGLRPVPRSAISFIGIDRVPRVGRCRGVLARQFRGRTALPALPALTTLPDLPAVTALTAFSRLAFGMLSAERLLLNPLARAGNCFTGRRADNFHPGLTRSGEPSKGPADGAAQKRLANRIIFNGFVNFGQPPAFSRRSLPR